ncbi:hypothetical protein [Bradyrhizobium iriomotense]|uniref:Uncharacterized protein n=1 Tax=Bradyrhizobium iriomotense TaxID=441950 RepID=A0ABQ6AW15_9BRAD|nr:hypothetical protein [Bradyrhizobium iriomotense]GLR84098.1 hypothetical protein GCM10007857_08080 [Bradyrhizobium iriomotense]
MTMKNFVCLAAIAPRRRLIGTALVYGLSLSVRFISATGEQVEVPSQAIMSIMTKNDTPIVHDGGPLKPAQPLALQLGGPLALQSCHAACERQICGAR